MKTLRPTTTPKVKLKNIEYLLLSIQSNPEKPQRWHLRRLHVYRYGREDHGKGTFNNGYFTSKSYRNVLWTDVSPQDVEYPVWAGTRMRSKSGRMVLTRRGWHRANKVRQALGLDTVEWSSNMWAFDPHLIRSIYQTGAQ